MDNAKAAEIKRLKQQLNDIMSSKVPPFVLSGGVMVVREWKARVEAARDAAKSDRPKLDDLRHCLWALQNIDKYVPAEVPLSAGQARVR